MHRWTVSIARPDGTHWRTVTLWAPDAATAVARGTRWTRREGLHGYTARAAIPATTPYGG